MLLNESTSTPSSSSAATSTRAEKSPDRIRRVDSASAAIGPVIRRARVMPVQIEARRTASVMSRNVETFAALMDGLLNLELLVVAPRGGDRPHRAGVGGRHSNSRREDAAARPSRRPEEVRAVGKDLDLESLAARDRRLEGFGGERERASPKSRGRSLARAAADRPRRSRACSCRRKFLESSPAAGRPERPRRGGARETSRPRRAASAIRLSAMSSTERARPTTSRTGEENQRSIERCRNPVAVKKSSPIGIAVRPM